VLTILRFIFSKQRVTIDTLCASLCIYLLLGFVWALGYCALSVCNDSAFTFSPPVEEPAPVMQMGRGNSIHALYYSLSTLTTLGYGDIVPRSSGARVLAVLEAIVGQLYLTVLVARLVGLHIVHSTVAE